jgi:hypothetical protein
MPRKTLVVHAFEPWRLKDKHTILKTACNTVISGREQTRGAERGRSRCVSWPASKRNHSADATYIKSMPNPFLTLRDPPALKAEPLQ